MHIGDLVVYIPDGKFSSGVYATKSPICMYPHAQTHIPANVHVPRYPDEKFSPGVQRILRNHRVVHVPIFTLKGAYSV